MPSVKGKTILVTGAGSGIGQALTVLLAHKGAHVAASDVNESGLAETAAMVSGDGGRVVTYKLDVADKVAFEQHIEDCEQEFGALDGIINNAGVTVSARVENTSYADFEWLMNINFWGVIHGTKGMLPKLQNRPNGWIVNISSVFGLVGWPTQASYNASKFAVRGFTEALRHELTQENSKVQAISVHPGGVKTGIVRNMRAIDFLVPTKTVEGADKFFQKAARTTPAKAAAIIVKGMEKNKPKVLVGPDAVVIDQMARRLPVSHFNVVRKLFGV